MAIDFPSSNRPAPVAGRRAANNADQPKAQYWLNIGYYVNAVVDGGPQKFVSLPQGIPLDTMEKVSTRSSNADFASLRTAQNELLDLILAKVGHLQPGEDDIVNLQIQVRRVSADVAIDPDSNAYSLSDSDKVKLQLVG